MKNTLLILFSMQLLSCSDKPAEHVIPVNGVIEKKAVSTEQTKEITKEAQAKKPTVKPGKITNLETGQLFMMLQSGSVYVIDVRLPIFFRLGHIDGAINFPKNKFEAMLPQQLVKIKQAIASGKIVVFYCQNENCADAYNMAMKFIKLGHSVSIYRGGWREWNRSGLD